tara:strand:- start:6337 stop:11367 length:5031 start_codon:yes stop_codon:yes gene_type:complete
MPKSIYDLKDFSGGLNTRIDKRDIPDTDFANTLGFSFDTPGIIKMMDRSKRHKYDGSTFVPQLGDNNYKLEEGYGAAFVSWDKAAQWVVLRTGESQDVSGLNNTYYLSNNTDSGGDWDTDDTFFVLKVISVNNSAVAGNKTITCYVIKPGNSTTSLHTAFSQQATVSLKKSTSIDGTSASTGIDITSTEGTEILNNPSFTSTANWTLGGTSGTNAWGITGNDLVLTANTGLVSGNPHYIYQPSSSMATSSELEAGGLYTLKITFDASANLSAGKSFDVLFGSFQPCATINQSDISSIDGEDVVYKTIKAGSAVQILGLLFATTDGTMGATAEITEISLKRFAVSWGSSDNWTNDTINDSSIFLYNSYDESIDQFNYTTKAWHQVMKESTTDANTLEPLILLDDDSSATVEIKPIMYAVDGALRVVDTNFKTQNDALSAARKPCESKWIGYISRKYFNDESVYTKWHATHMDIKAPTDGYIYEDNHPLNSTQLADGFINMKVNKRKPNDQITTWESCEDSDGWYAGKSNKQNFNFNFPISRQAFDVSYPDYPVPLNQDGTERNAVMGLAGRSINQAKFIFQYHSGTDGTSNPSEAFDKAIDLSSSGSSSISFDLFIHPDALANLRTDNFAMSVWIGNLGDYPASLGAEFDETFDGDFDDSTVAAIKFEFNKEDLTEGWGTYSVDANRFDKVIGSFDAKNVKDFVLYLYPKYQSFGTFGDILNLPAIGDASSDDNLALNVPTLRFKGSAGDAINRYREFTNDVILGLITKNVHIVKLEWNEEDSYCLDNFVMDISAESSSSDGGMAHYTNHYDGTNGVISGIKQNDDSTTITGSALNNHFQVGDLIMFFLHDNAYDNASSILDISSSDNENKYEFATITEVDTSGNTLRVSVGHNDGDLLTHQMTNADVALTISDAVDSKNRFVVLRKTADGSGNKPIKNLPYAISNIRYGKKSSGEWNGKYKFFYSWVYDDNQESKLFEFKMPANDYNITSATDTNEITFNEETAYINFSIKEASINGGWNHATAGSKRISKANIYYTKMLEEGEFGESPQVLLGELDLNKGFKVSGESEYNQYQGVNPGTYVSKDLVIPVTDGRLGTGASGDGDIISNDGDINFGTFSAYTPVANDKVRVKTTTKQFSDDTFSRDFTVKEIITDNGSTNDTLTVYDPGDTIDDASTADEAITVSKILDYEFQYNISEGVKSSSLVDFSSINDIPVETPPAVELYDSVALYSDKNIDYNNAKFKAYAFNDNYMYIGNVLQNGVVHGDRILKSLPGRMDLFPEDNFIVVTENDGDEIVALQAFNDRLLEFKNKVLNVINVSGSTEYLEASFKHMGIKGHNAVCKSNLGVVFANDNGMYIYTGEGEPANLTAKISSSDWTTFVDGHSNKLACFYVPEQEQVGVVNGYKQSAYYQDVYLFDLKTKSITKGQSILDLERNYSNFMYDDVNNKCIWINQDFASSLSLTYTNTFDNTLTDNTVTHSAISADVGSRNIDTNGLDALYDGEAANVDTNGSHGFLDGLYVDINDNNADNAHDGTYKVFKRDADKFFIPAKSAEIDREGTVILSTSPQGVHLETKHLDFGSPNVRKKIHSIAISHKGSGGTLELQYEITNDSGTSDWTDAGTLTDYDNYQRQVFSISSNNIYTIGFRIVADGTSAVSVPYDFSINDMGIVYRAKNVK